jgi:predicted alpha/beta superfamily hydrolase
MRIYFKVIVLWLHAALVIYGQNLTPNVVSGTIERIEDFPSTYVQPRNIDIWLPAGYSAKTEYAVLYMHDGQMLFDPQMSWNKQSWNVDDIASSLILEERIEKFIVVGIWNSGQNRHSDYFPQKPFELLSDLEKDTVTAQLQRAGRTKDTFEPQSDLYLKFLVEELKPYIDQKYSVKSNSPNTYIAGSSMGGLISIYALCEYPNVFGGAACLSSHWVGTFTLENNPFPNSILSYLVEKLPKAGKHKIYFDCGDETLDALYPKIQKEVDNIMKEKGYSSSDWLTRYFPGEDHSEKAWNKRLHIPLEFLFGE